MALMETPPGAIGWKLPSFELSTPLEQQFSAEDAMGSKAWLLPLFATTAPMSLPSHSGWLVILPTYKLWVLGYWR